MSLTTKVSNMETEVIQLRATNESLSQSYLLLTEQVRRLQSDLLLKTHEADEATRAVAEVEKLIEGAATMLIAGINKIRASKSPLIRQHEPEPESKPANTALPAPEFT